MTPQEKQQLYELSKKVEDLYQQTQVIINLYNKENFPNKMVLYRNFQTKGAIGFFTKEPVQQQTATDLATLLTALKAYGIIAP